MIYMCSIKSNNRLKIGYTKDFKDRERAYWTNCGDCFQLIDVIEGTPTDEKNYQLTLESMGFIPVDDERDTEWFTIPTHFSKREILKKGFEIFK